MAYQTCPKCKGSGKYKNEVCGVCDGLCIIDEKTGLPPNKIITRSESFFNKVVKDNIGTNE